MKHPTTRTPALNGVLAALYAALTIASAPLSYGAVQFRIAEALCVLPFCFPSTTLGLTAGCLIANLFSPVTALDAVVGTAATFLACLLTARMPSRYLAPLPPVLANAVLVGGMLATVYTPGAFWQSFGLMAAQVALGEAAVLYALGLPLLLLVQRRRG